MFPVIRPQLEEKKNRLNNSFENCSVFTIFLSCGDVLIFFTLLHVSISWFEHVFQWQLLRKAIRSELFTRTKNVACKVKTNSEFLQKEFPSIILMSDCFNIEVYLIYERSTFFYIDFEVCKMYQKLLL